MKQLFAGKRLKACGLMIELVCLIEIVSQQTKVQAMAYITYISVLVENINYSLFD